MTFDIGQFRTNFPEFADTARYPTQMIQFWLSIITQQVTVTIWKNMWSQGVSLYLAHELVLATQNVQSAQVGGTPGQQGGIATQKGVGSVNVSYDANTTTEKDAGWWNLTTYGKQFYRLVRIFGAGCVQL